MAKPFCSLPWNGIHISQNLDVFFCCLMARPGNSLGNLKDSPIEEILHGNTAQAIRQSFNDGVIPAACNACEFKTGDIVNDFTADEKRRVLEHKQLTPTVIHSADIRSSNLCTLDCVYCNPDWSSTIAKRDGYTHLIPSAEKQRQYQSRVETIDLTQCRKLILAGGEPLLMKEYIPLLEKILEYNPNCSININTGLSVIDTPVFDLLCQLKNVTWFISADNTVPDKFAYIRHGNTWDNFEKNLKTIRSIPGHTILAHMVYFSLSYKDFGHSIRTLRSLGVDGFLIDPVFHPALDIRNIPNQQDSIKQDLDKLFAEQLITEQTYNQLMGNINLPFNCLQSLHDYLGIMDAKYSMNSREIFPELY